MEKWEKQKQPTDPLLKDVIDRINDFYGITRLKATRLEDDIKGWDLEDSDKKIRIGVRLRDYIYIEKYDYSNEFTIRSKVASGNKTEYDKIINKESKLSIFIYGFMTKNKKGIAKLTSISPDSDKAIELLKNKIFDEKPNKNEDGTFDGSWFKIFKIKDAKEIDIVDFIYENGYTYSNESAKDRLVNILRSNNPNPNPNPNHRPNPNERH